MHPTCWSKLFSPATPAHWLTFLLVLIDRWQFRWHQQDVCMWSGSSWSLQTDANASYLLFYMLQVVYCIDQTKPYFPRISYIRFKLLQHPACIKSHILVEKLAVACSWSCRSTDAMYTGAEGTSKLFHLAEIQFHHGNYVELHSHNVFFTLIFLALNKNSKSI